MASLCLLIDFGSTWTKVTAVDLRVEELVGQAKSLTTVDTDILTGLEAAVAELERQIGRRHVFGRRLACSSAAGGLQMVAIGLVPDLTTEAARRAALGAGARVRAVYAYELTRAELRQIEQQSPDIILLAGGTDGGNQDAILHNAELLAGSGVKAPIIVAGNKVCSEAVAEVLLDAGKDARVTENVMPEVWKLNVDPARLAIREVFMEKIVEAKGLHRARAIVDDILMPTPAAVLKAARALSQGGGREEGIGELLVVDIGGATTDVHSLASGEPSRPGIVQRGLAEPFAKRTVEGDLGVRVSALSLYEAVGPRRLLDNIGLPPEELPLPQALEELTADVGRLPRSFAEIRLDQGLARTAVEMAVDRHAGYIETVTTPFGVTYFQYGKDLTQVDCIIGTGGPFIHSTDPEELFFGALFDPDNPTILKPEKPQFLLDKNYVMAPLGLLAPTWPGKAVRMLKKYLVSV